jgi:small-conductance mechanosensitive channel
MQQLVSSVIFLLEHLKYEAISILENPSTYSQLTIVAAFTAIAFFIGILGGKWFNSFARDYALSHQGSHHRFRSFIFRLAKMIFPLSLWLLYMLTEKICQSSFSASFVPRFFSNLALVYLLRQFIHYFVKDLLLKAIGFTVFMPIVILHLFGVYEDVSSYLDSVIINLGSIKVSAFGVVHAIVSCIIVIWIAGIIMKGLENYVRSKDNISSSNQELIIKIISMGIVLTSIVLLLQTLGVNSKTLALFGGALGVGIGFGLQKIASNFISGIILVLERSIKVGDWIELKDGTFGRLSKLGMRASIIETIDGKEVMIPNEDFITNRIINWTNKTPKIRYYIPFSVEYHADCQLVIDVVKEALQTHHKVLVAPEAPDCEMVSFGDHGINFRADFWAEGISYGKQKFLGSIALEIYKALRAKGINIPYPKVDMFVNQK